jgi:hypothetical protein
VTARAKRLFWPVMIGLFVLVLLFGCRPVDQSPPPTIPDGVRTIPTSAVGSFYQGPGSATCRWWITLDSAVVNAGTRNPAIKPAQRKRTQRFLVYKHWGGKAKLHSDNCGPWKP